MATIVCWRSGDFRLGLNEVQVGLFPGALIHGAFRRLVGGHAAQLLTRGALIDPATALRVGLVDELCEASQVARARSKWRVNSVPCRANPCCAPARWHARTSLELFGRPGTCRAARSASSPPWAVDMWFVAGDAGATARRVHEALAGAPFSARQQHVDGAGAAVDAPRGSEGQHRRGLAQDHVHGGLETGPLGPEPLPLPWMMRTQRSRAPRDFGQELAQRRPWLLRRAGRAGRTRLRRDIRRA